MKRPKRTIPKSSMEIKTTRKIVPSSASRKERHSNIEDIEESGLEVHESMEDFVNDRAYPMEEPQMRFIASHKTAVAHSPFEISHYHVKSTETVNRNAKNLSSRFGHGDIKSHPVADAMRWRRRIARPSEAISCARVCRRLFWW